MNLKTLTQFAKLHDTEYHVIKTACEKGRLNFQSIPKPNGVNALYVIMDEKAASFDPDGKDKEPEVVLKYEVNENGELVPQDSWTYKNDCLGGAISAMAAGYPTIWNRPVPIAPVKCL